jgi:hypothetical protein
VVVLVVAARGVVVVAAAGMVVVVVLPAARVVVVLAAARVVMMLAPACLVVVLVLAAARVVVVFATARLVVLVLTAARVVVLAPARLVVATRALVRGLEVHPAGSDLLLQFLDPELPRHESILLLLRSLRRNATPLIGQPCNRCQSDTKAAPARWRGNTRVLLEPSKWRTWHPPPMTYLLT